VIAALGYNMWRQEGAGGLLEEGVQTVTVEAARRRNRQQSIDSLPRRSRKAKTGGQ